jgi:putative transposase
VLVRYRYRLYPSPGQCRALARAFGCARVVYNDCLRLRKECYGAGEKISDASVQRRVVTLAKLTPEREWLAEAPSVALVQACNDARRAYRNYFDSLSGHRKGGRIGHPRFRSKRGRQSIRLTPQRIQPARAAAVCRESGPDQGPLVPFSAQPAVVGDGDS